MCKLGHVLEASFRKQNSYKKIQNHVDPSTKRTSNITDYGVYGSILFSNHYAKSVNPPVNSDNDIRQIISSETEQ